MSYEQFDPNQNQQGAPPPQGQYPPPQQQYDAPAPYQPSGAPAVGAASASQNQPLLCEPERFDYGLGQYRDKWWAVLFFVHLLGMGAIAGMWGGDLIKQDSQDDGGGNKGLNNLTDEPVDIDNLDLDLQTVLVGVMLGAVAAGLFAALWLKVMKKYADTIIKISLVISCAFLGISAGLALYAGSMITAVILLVILGLKLLFFYFVRHRIPFTQAVLDASTTSILEHPATVCVVYVLMFLQVIWVACWSFTFLSVLAHVNKNSTGDDDNTDTTNSQYGGVNGIAFFFLLVSLYWTAQVLKNVGHVTTAGTVASWWMVPTMASPTRGAFKRAITTSFGSICFGSLVVAILQAMRAMLQMAKSNARRSNNDGAACALACLDCILSCIERMVEYFNMYAYTMVAVYGKDFIGAAKDTWALLKARGFDVLINDDLTGMVLGMGMILGGCVAGVVGGGYAFYADSDNSVQFGLVAGLAFLVGFVMTSLVMNVVESAVATTYVVWAEDPQMIASTRPESFNKIAGAARALHPQSQF